MALRDELLIPIPGENPGGIELRYDPLYDKIKEARREDDDAPQGDWQTARKTADWPLVIKLSKEAIARKSKDLQLGAWLTEAMLRREGIAGLQAGLELLDGLVEQFWDSLYPAIEDGDAEMRAAPLEWVGSRLEISVRTTAINRAGHTFLQYTAAQLIPTEDDAARDDAKAAAREEAIATGKVTPEAFESGFAVTPKEWYKALAADVESAIEALGRLDEHSRDRFGPDAPSFGRLKGALEELQRAAGHLLRRKLQADPDPAESIALDSAPSVSLADVAPSTAHGGLVAPAPSVGAARTIAADATTGEDAAARVVAAARYLRQADPYNPASYLILRGFRWGELRARGQDVDPRLLEAPPTQVRTQLKTLLLDARWPELLEACETVMGTPQGRGWLDLQRYMLTACDSLESGYQFVARAVRAELRTLLSEVPRLLDMTLMDDTPTANAETRAWLRGIVTPDGAVAASAADDGVDVAAQPRDARALAVAEVRAGRPERAIALLNRQAAAEKTRRNRFLLETQLAGVMVEAGHEAVAQPILEELVTRIDEHKLEEWEGGDVVAQPMALLIRCIDKLDGDTSTKQSLYLRICRLDPLQAISVANGQQTSEP